MPCTIPLLPEKRAWRFRNGCLKYHRFENMSFSSRANHRSDSTCVCADPSDIDVLLFASFVSITAPLKAVWKETETGMMFAPAWRVQIDTLSTYDFFCRRPFPRGKDGRLHLLQTLHNLPDVRAFSCALKLRTLEGKGERACRQLCVLSKCTQKLVFARKNAFCYLLVDVSSSKTQNVTMDWAWLMFAPRIHFKPFLSTFMSEWKSSGLKAENATICRHVFACMVLKA